MSDDELVLRAGDPRFQRHCPQLWKAIHGRRYLLPNYRQGDYERQDALDDEMELGLLTIALGAASYGDDVHRAQFANFALGLKYQRLIMYLESELGQGLVDSPLPAEMETSDVHWPADQMRIMLPKGLLTIERGGELRNVMYMDVALIGQGGVSLPAPYGVELETWVKEVAPRMYADPQRVPMTKLNVMQDEIYICVVCQIDYSEQGFGPTTYAYTAPWNNQTLGKLVSYSGNLHGALNCDDADDALLDKMKTLAINCLLFMGQKPVLYVPKVVRSLRQEGKHIKPALHHAQFIGEEKYRAAVLRYQAARAEATATGRTVLPHRVKGHWQRIVHGKGRALRRWQWIFLYWTGKEYREAK